MRKPDWVENPATSFWIGPLRTADVEELSPGEKDQRGCMTAEKKGIADYPGNMDSESTLYKLPWESLFIRLNTLELSDIKIRH